LVLLVEGSKEEGFEGGGVQRRRGLKEEGFGGGGRGIGRGQSDVSFWY
jgi:hypothetical protein